MCFSNLSPRHIKEQEVNKGCVSFLRLLSGGWAASLRLQQVLAQPTLEGGSAGGTAGSCTLDVTSFEVDDLAPLQDAG